MSTITIILVILGAFAVYFLYKWFNKPTIHHDLELKAELLALSHDVDEIKRFLDAKMNYLTRESFNILLDRIKQLDSDKSYVDSLVRDKIDKL